MGYFDLRPPINSSGSEVCHLEGFDISLQTKIEKHEVVSKLLTCTTAKRKLQFLLHAPGKQARSGGAPASASASMTAADGPLARLTIDRHPALGSAVRGAACFGGRSRSGYPSLLLRPLFPNRLVTGSFLIGWLLEYSESC